MSMQSVLLLLGTIAAMGVGLWAACRMTDLLTADLTRPFCKNALCVLVAASAVPDFLLAATDRLSFSRPDIPVSLQSVSVNACIARLKRGNAAMAVVAGELHIRLPRGVSAVVVSDLSKGRSNPPEPGERQLRQFTVLWCGAVPSDGKELLLQYLFRRTETNAEHGILLRNMIQ